MYSAEFSEIQMEKRVQFECREYAYKHLVSGWSLHRGEPSNLERDIVYLASRSILARDCEVTERAEISWPLDWWQNVKQRFFPNWLLKRYPVLFARKVVVLHATARALLLDVQPLERRHTIVYIISESGQR